ncbi:hypothetical protein U2A4042250001 [Corynebacterium striatum]|nr:hypothetical protein U2A4042250001 [Corynebacterium striatum]
MKDEMAANMPAAIQSMGPEGAQYAQQFAAASGGSSHLTPSLVAQLPDAIQSVILNAYNDGLTPVILLMVPLAIVALLLVLPITEEHLKEEIS